MNPIESKPRSKSPYKITLTDDEDTNQLIRDLIKKRAIVKSRLTRFSSYVNGFKSDEILPSQTQVDLKLRLQGATSLYAEFTELQSKIEESVLDVDLEEQLNQRDAFEDNYYSTLARAERMIKLEEVTSACSKRCHSHNDTIKLPTISVPTFDGSCDRWLEFRDTFQSLVHESTQISSIQKFHYLKSSLKGSAALVIDSVEFSSDNYSVAWELLLNRFNNNKLLIHSHIKALFTLQAMTKEAPDLLRNLIDSYLKNLRALKILGEPVDSWDTILIYIIVSKLDKTTERAWEQYRNTILNKSEDSKSRLKVEVLLTFLKDRADMLDTLQANCTKTNDTKKHHTNSNSKVHCNVSSTKSKPHATQRSCLLCKSNHSLYACSKFLALDLNARLKVVRDNKLCENCLRPGGHTAADCRFGPCRKCENIKHNSLICDKGTDPKGQVPSPAVQSDEKRPSIVSLASLKTTAAPQLFETPMSMHTETLCAQYPCVQRVLLSTALVLVRDKFNNYHLARTLLDSGSERCLIKKSLCDILNIPVIQSAQEIRGVGNSVTQATLTCDIEIKSRTSSYTTRLQCIVLPNITSTFPAIPKQDAQCKIPNNLQLADPDFYEGQSIDLLIGADKFWDLLSQGKMRLPAGPFLQNTRLGWIISGPLHINARNKGHIQCNFSQSVNDQLRLFWEIEELPKPCDTRTEEEKACEDHFVKTTTRNNDGRFCVNIPLKLSPHELGETHPQAINRFMSLERRLQRVPEYKKMYSDFIHEYENLGHMTRIDTYGTPHCFMPHHGVFREHSTTTKLRVVFDASFPSSTSISFNSLQRVGPPIQGDLLAILLRLRQHRYVACADVEKMYRQILVAEDQRDLQLIVWRDDPKESLGIYRLNTVVYGTASAPFLAVRCLKELGFTSSDPDVKRVITEDFFVDDMITGLDDKDKLTELCRKVYEALQSGCFPLRKWIFNFECDQSVFNGIKQLNLEGKGECKTLGIGWNNSTDEFNYNTTFKHDAQISKRTILSHVSQIFDPLGLLSPAIIIAKTLLQKLWLTKTDWDDALPNDVIEAWNRFANSLAALNDIVVPRHAIGLDPVSIELHIFTDASQVAYGACAYIRTITKNNTICNRLLCAKAKVAPVKPLTIPRLELSGAVLGARLYKKISESLHCQFDSVTFWTDSTIVLGWLRMAPNLLKTFVQNRIVEIHELTGELPWRHVSGKDNPADMASRGVLLNDLATSTLWWEGPCFLRDHTFGRSGIVPDQDQATMHEDLPEVKSNSVLVCTEERDLFPFSRFSQFNRMRCTFAYVLRFLHNTRNYKINQRTGALSSDELRRAELGLAKLSQSESYGEEYELINKTKTRNLKPSLLKLNLFIDKDSDLIRVGGRIGNSNEFDYNKRHPILLNSKHRFTILLLRHEHKRLLHAAPQALLYEVRQQWWPVGGRNLARQVVHECILCKRLKGDTLHPLMGNLPKERVTPTYPFLYCGVDYAGPVLTLNRKGRGARTVKSYICLFICFSTRAVHLELVSDLTSDSYILALKRFISRRAKPLEITSDNGKNFVGTMNEFGKFLTRCSDDISEYAVSQSITFKFVPAYSPHFGGLWEAGVKSSKYHLTRVIGNAHLTFEELTTVLTQVESILNSRPLSPMSSDPQDFLPLSPAHFLVGRSLTAPVYEDMRNQTGSHLSRYQRVEQMRHHFWERWSKEYISELQTRCKWMSGVDTLQPGMMVVIKDDNLPPLKWHLGRIINAIPGKDGISRVADIRTPTGVVRRSFAKICPLFCEEEVKKTTLEPGDSKAGGM
ncbi:uncharacterized protein LOC123873546 [Maniola jurtina]|uniref:uncharacterized protein LOC123873546 n=1 Tax=Maniola jurtina TaxID=191418 RepID=UPI001E68B7B7|nr:uncharacterized protein LOC123873546 [Maniola jurtina]